MFRTQPFVYTLEPPRLADNAVDEFLFSTRKGFCEHYASAFTIVMRAAGIPARIVTGYQGGEFNPYGGYLIVRQSDAHAWSEVWIEGSGWRRVDPTAAVAPERIQGGLIRAVSADEPVPGRLRDASELWMSVELGWDAINDFWNQRVIRFDAQSQFDLLERLGLEEPDWRALGLGLAASLAAFFVALTAYLGWTYRPPQRDWPARLHDLAARTAAQAWPRAGSHRRSRAFPAAGRGRLSGPRARPGRNPPPVCRAAIRPGAVGARPAAAQARRQRAARLTRATASIRVVNTGDA